MSVDRVPVVAHVFKRLDPGGAELRTIDLASRLRSQVRTIFVVTDSRAGALEERVREGGFEIVHIPLGPRFLLGLRRLVRTQGVTTVHSHASTTSGLFCALAAVSGVPRRIAHFRSDSDGKPDTPARSVKRALMRALIRAFATDVVGVSPMALRYAGGWISRSTKGQIIPSGIDLKPLPSLRRMSALRAEFAVGEDESMIVHVGRELLEKNRPRAVAIIACAQRHGLDMTLVIVGRLGDGEEEALSRLASQLGVQERVRVVGQRHDVQDVLAAADACLVTSTREGLPGVVLESVGVGTPCVASKLPGVLWLAESFSGVLPVGLEEPDDRWVELLRDNVEQTAERDRADDRRSLEQSPFSLSSAVEAYRRLWSGVRT